MNDFGETDFVVDLFKEIETAFDCGHSIFDEISKDDLIIAFFPCVRFENQVMLHFRGQAYGMEKWSLKKKMLNCMKLQEELTNYNALECKDAIRKMTKDVYMTIGAKNIKVARSMISKDYANRFIREFIGRNDNDEKI